MTTPDSPTETDKHPNAAGPDEQVKADNKTIGRMVWAWTLLAPLAFIIIWAATN